MKRVGVAAVDRALQVLAAFRDGDTALELSDLAARTGLYKSTILRLCASLERHGYLRRLASGAFRLGPAPLRLGHLYQQSFRLDDVIRPALAALAARSGESASFYVREGSVRVCLFRADSPHTVRDHVREGAQLPLERGAAGKVLLAFGGARGRVFARIRRRLLAVSHGERDPETAAVACPVFDAHGALAGALALSGPRYRFTRSAVASMTGLLLRTAADLTVALGGDRAAFDRVMSRGGEAA
jgi:DNA-binding IclR family transcriptional regulator